jgi:GNAT superfamily N-acetyltransferase
LPDAKNLVPLIRLSTPTDRDEILAFIERMGFNPRDAVTWDGLHMLAMTAWNKDRLLGAIPLEPRILRIGQGQTIQSVHETVVAVDPEYRNAGIGSLMQQAIADQRPAGAELITVFREEPDSPAYRWYLKNGFFKAIRIISWFCDEPLKTAGSVLPVTWMTCDSSLPWIEVEEAWAHHRGANSPGRVDRSSRSLQRWLAVHPYRHRYSFRLVADSNGGFALLGVGAMHSETIRADVLELMPSHDDPSVVESLLRAIAARAAHEGWHPIRLPLSEDDRRAMSATSLGFSASRSFDMLIRPIGDVIAGGRTSPSAVDRNWRAVMSALQDSDPTENTPDEFEPAESLASWRYSGVDYI